ncbi:MAG: hypothetical protein ACRBC3_13775 [Burkholderiaceae bacterium]
MRIVRSVPHQSAAQSSSSGWRWLAGLLALSTLAACGGGNDDDTSVSSNCRPGLIQGFDQKVGDAPIASVSVQEGQGGDGEGGVGGGEGNGIGGADGQYRNVAVTVETVDGKTYGPLSVDDTKGMVTYVPCNEPLPVKVTFEGKAVDATYYDEGLKRDVSFFSKRRIGLITALDTNTGVTPLSHALYERAMEIGRVQGSAEGWKNPTIIGQAHAELLALINDQLPSIYRVTDLRRLPIALNADNDRVGSNTLEDNQNGVYGAILAGLAKTGTTTLPASTAPALDLADVLIDDLRDAKIDLKSPDGVVLSTADKLPYTFETLWTQAAVSTGSTAQENGNGNLQSDKVVIGYVRHRDEGMGGTVETEYILTSSGELITNLNPDVGGGNVQRPADGIRFSQLLFFAADQPVAALRRDGKGVLMFSNPADGSASFEVPAPGGKTFVELMDGASAVVRVSDGSLMRFNGGSNSFVNEPTPPGVINFTFRPEFAGALPPGGDTELGADPNGDDNNGLCIGASLDGKVKLWRPVFAPGEQVAGLDQTIEDIVQVSSDQVVSLGLRSDGALFHLDANHSVLFRNPNGSVATELDGDETRELLTPAADPLLITAPRMCWTRAPYVIGCDGSVYEVEYPKFADATGAVQGAGPVTGITKLPIPSPVWRTRANRGDDLVFIGTDGKVYEADGTALTLPL